MTRLLLATLAAVLALAQLAGCAAHYDPQTGFTATFLKDVFAKVKTPNGFDAEVSSNVNGEALKAVAEGAARGAATAAKP